jgi:DNA-binding transcriptional regulator YdaS (Cro superfamily)
MDLKTYLVAHDGKLLREGRELRRVAGFCDVSPYYLCQLAAGHKTASPELAANIEYATRKVVNRRVTLPAFPWDEPARAEAHPSKRKKAA